MPREERTPGRAVSRRGASEQQLGLRWFASHAAHPFSLLRAGRVTGQEIIQITTGSALRPCSSLKAGHFTAPRMLAGMRYRSDRLANVRLRTGVGALLGRIGRIPQERNEGVSFVGHALLTLRIELCPSSIFGVGEEDADAT